MKRIKPSCVFQLVTAALFIGYCCFPMEGQSQQRADDPTKKTTWLRYSTENGDLDVPNKGNQQTASLVVDLDNDGINDFVITERTAAPAVVWYRRHSTGWTRHVIEKEPLRIEAGSAWLDIDNDGDHDIVFGGESQSNEVWWWENPHPDVNEEAGWVRHTIKKGGATKHHDQMFGDFDGDGQVELVFWNQHAATLYMAEIPDKPREADTWPLTPIYTYSTDSEMEPVIGAENYPGWQSVNEHEGLFASDIDGDGLEDIVGGGRWFKFRDGRFIENLIDASYTFTRTVAGQFIEGGRPEVILVVGDGLGPMFMYEWQEYDGHKKGTGTWKRKMIVEELDNGHTLEVIDFNRDGHWDIFSAEMRFGENNPDARMRILLGDGKGGFSEYVIATGYGVHEGKIADLDGDGDPDILAKPYTWQAPRLDIWINEED